MTYNYGGKYILLLGGSSDIALESAKFLSSAGLRPVLTYRSEESLKKIKTFLGEKGNYETLSFSLDNEPALFLNEIKDYNFDYMVDFSQTDLESLVAGASEDDIEEYFHKNISVKSIILKEITRKMVLQKRGRLIFISSTAALRPNRGQGYYAASKVAMEALYRNTGIELASRGITTLSLRFGYIDGGRGKEYLSTDILKKIPVNRAITIREVAENIGFFLSDSAVVLNATEIVIDGGLTAAK